MRKYGILLIGCGHIGNEHIADMYYRDDVHFVGVVDCHEEAAQLTARKYGVPEYGTDYRPFLKRAEVDIVIIATYTSTHLSILKDCLAAGKHVLCEKPMAKTAEEGAEFVREVRAHPECKVLIAHILRHNASYIRIRELIQSGAIGELKLMRMVQNHHVMNPGRYGRLLADCTPLVDCGVHYIDVMQWFSGASVCEVSGIGTSIDANLPGHNYTMATFRLTDGCVGYYEAGWSCSTASQNLKEFIGTRGRIALTLCDNRPDNREEGDLIQVYHSDTGVYETINLESRYKNMYLQMQTLFEMIETGDEGSPTLEEAYSALRVALRADEAIRTRQVLPVETV